MARLVKVQLPGACPECGSSEWWMMASRGGEQAARVSLPDVSLPRWRSLWFLLWPFWGIAWLLASRGKRPSGDLGPDEAACINCGHRRRM